MNWLSHSLIPIKFKAEDLDQNILEKAWRIIEENGKAIFESLQRSIIRDIQKYGQDTMSSGEDSGLTNLWDEYCVQLQSEPGWNFSMQQDLVQTRCFDKLVALKENKKPDYNILILYISVCYNQNDDMEMVILSDSEISNWVFNSINSIAANYNNQKIEKYIFG